MIRLHFIAAFGRSIVSIATARHAHSDQIVRNTTTPRTAGLFGIGGTDFSQTKIVDNVIECCGQPRPLLRNKPSYGAEIRNNRLTNVSDTDRYENATDTKPGLKQPLKFSSGVRRELIVDGWETRSSTNSLRN